MKLLQDCVLRRGGRIAEQVDSKLSNSKYILKRPSKKPFRLNLATWGIGNCSEWNSLQFEYQFAAQIGLVGQKNTIFYPDLSSLVLTWNLGYPLIKFGYVVARGLKIHKMTRTLVIFGAAIGLFGHFLLSQKLAFLVNKKRLKRLKGWSKSAEAYPGGSCQISELKSEKQLRNETKSGFLDF